MKPFYHFSLFLLIAINLSAQQVTNVRDVQQGNNIKITYDLVGNNNIEQFQIDLYVSLDGGQSWRGPLSQVSGDVGPSIQAGQGKTITWRVLEEFGDLQGSNIVFKVDASFTPTRFDFEPEMVFVEGGRFLMGSDDPEADDDERPVHSVVLSDFYIGKYEVTNAQFCAFLNEKGNREEGGVEWLNLNGMLGGEKSRIRVSGNNFFVEKGYEDHPVIFVTWFGARAFCNWLKDKTGKNYQLPTESQWEFAARGGNKSLGYKYSGSNDLKTVGWYDNNSGLRSQKIGQKKPNELGIYDMSGNVSEWCLDVYVEYNQYPSSKDPTLIRPDYGKRVIRGGNFHYGFCRVSARDLMDDEDRLFILGFRVVVQ